MKFKIAKLHFQSGLHLGSDYAGIGKETVLPLAHSDTIFSCLLNAYAELNGKPATDTLLSEFHKNDEEPPFKISSGYLFHDGFRETYFYLPKPVCDPADFCDPQNGQAMKLEFASKIKKMSWLDLETFVAWLQGKNIVPRIFHQDDKFHVLSQAESRPHQASDRLTMAASIYHIGVTHFNINAGLYFILQLNEDLFSESEFQQILNHAGFNGLGGRRASGNGVFSTELVELDEEWQTLFSLPPQNAFITLSLFYPARIGEVDPLAYQLAPRRGWTFSPFSELQLKRKSCWMFAEGSIFRNKQDGRLAEVKPDAFTAHPIYRYGVPMFFPFNYCGD